MDSTSTAERLTVSSGARSLSSTPHSEFGVHRTPVQAEPLAQDPLVGSDEIQGHRM